MHSDGLAVRCIVYCTHIKQVATLYHITDSGWGTPLEMYAHLSQYSDRLPDTHLKATVYVLVYDDGATRVDGWNTGVRLCRTHPDVVYSAVFGEWITPELACV